MCNEPKKLKNVFNKINADYVPVGDCPYGDGRAAKKIFDVVRNEI